MKKEEYSIDQELDVRGLHCPLPILRAKKSLAAMDSGAVLKIITTDPHAWTDFQAFCQRTGHSLLAQEKQEQEITHIVRRR